MGDYRPFSILRDFSWQLYLEWEPVLEAFLVYFNQAHAVYLMSYFQSKYVWQLNQYFPDFHGLTMVLNIDSNNLLDISFYWQMA